MKKAFLSTLLLSVFFFVNNATAQSWDWAKGLLGGSEGQFICTGPKGNVYMAGCSGATNSVTISGTDTLRLYNNINAWNGGGLIVVCYDSSGNLKYLKGTENAWSLVQGIAADVHGNLYLLGAYAYDSITIGNYSLHNPDTNFWEYFIAKYDSSGSVIFAKNICKVAFVRYSASMIATTANSIYISGQYDTVGGATMFGQTGHRSFIAKLDTSANVIWTDSIINAYSLGLAVSSAGNVYSFGTYVSSATFENGISLNDNYAYYVSKCDSNGTVKWAKSLPAGTFIDSAEMHGLLDVLYSHTGAIATDKYENAYITSFFDSSIAIGTNLLYTSSIYGNSFLAKFDSSGSIHWAKTIADSVKTYSLCTDPCGNIWVSGGTAAWGTIKLGNIDGHHLALPAFSPDPMFIGCWDSSGAYITALAFASGGDDNNAIASDPYGNIFVGGDYIFGPYSFGNDILPYDSVALDTSLMVINDEDIFVLKYVPGICTSSSNIPTKEKKYEVNVFPNPAYDQFTISLPETANGEITMQLYNLQGQMVYSQRLTSANTNISTTSLPAGMYICKVSANGQGVITKKIQIEK